MSYRLVTTLNYLVQRINKICEKYLLSWMRNFISTDDRPTPLPMDPAWMKKFNAAIGDPDTKVQARLAKTMEISYRSGVGMGNDYVLPGYGVRECQTFTGEF